MKKLDNILFVAIIIAFIVLVGSVDAVPNQPGDPVEYKVDVTFYFGSYEFNVGSIGWTTVDASVTVEVPAGCVVKADADSTDEDNIWDGKYSGEDQSDKLTNKWDANFDGVYEITGKSTGYVNILPNYKGTTKNMLFKVSDENTAYVEKPNGIVGTVHLKVVGATVELSGINYNDIQNIPINAKVPTAMDGTENVDMAKIRAKATVTGFPEVRYTVYLSKSTSGNGNVNIPECVTVTTDENGTGSEEFVIIGTTKSSVLDDITIKGELKYFDQVLDNDEESITVYQINLVKGAVGNGDFDSDTRVSGSDPTAERFRFTIPTEWTNKVYKGEVEWNQDQYIDAESICVSDSTKGGFQINSFNSDNHDTQKLSSYYMRVDCNIDTLSDPANAYAGKVKGKAVIKAKVRLGVDTKSTLRHLVSTSDSFGISVPLDGIDVSYSWTINITPPPDGADALAMAIMGVKFPYIASRFKDMQEMDQTTVTDEDPPIDADDHILEVSPDNDVILQVGSNPIKFSLSLETKAHIIDNYVAEAEAQYKGFLTDHTTVELDGDFELVPTGQ